MDRAEQDAVEHHRTPHHDHDHESSVDGAVADPASQLLSDIGNAGMGRILGDGGGVHRSAAAGGQQLDESVARAIEERRGRGRPLDESTRAEMEGALGHDLSDVRVHTDRDAHDLNESVGARAFTTGSDVFFTQGTYDPGSASGKELLGHELTHVAQQREGTSGLAAGEVSRPSDPAEQHAADVGKAIADGSAASPASASAEAPTVARDEDDEDELMGAWEAGLQREKDEELEDELPGG